MSPELRRDDPRGDLRSPPTRRRPDDQSGRQPVHQLPAIVTAPTDKRRYVRVEIESGRLPDGRAFGLYAWRRRPVRVCWNRFSGPLPAGAKSVMRPTRWGNPFTVADCGSRAEAVRLYREHLARTPDLADAVRRELVGYDLACSCPLGGPCHGEVLLDVANRRATPDGGAP